MKLRYFLWLLFLCSYATVFSQSLPVHSFIHFDVDQHALDDQAMADLNTLITELESHSDFQLQIIGHTDQDGSDVYNERLAEARATEVHEYLVSMGLPETNISMDSQGEKKLLVNENSSLAKQKNRRVELQYRTWNYESVEDFTAAIGQEDPVQKFTCDEKAYFFDLKNGSSIYIPKDAFVHMDGSAVTGPVDLEIIEAFNYSDIVANNLSTETKDELLETGGMMNIQATSGGKELRLDKSLELIYPVQKEEEGMEVFYGVEEEDGLVSWEAAGVPVRTTQVKNDPLMVDLSLIVNYEFGKIEEPKIQFDKMPVRPRAKDMPYPPSKQIYSESKYQELYANYEKNLQAYYDNKPLEQRALDAWYREVTKRVERIDEYKKEMTEYNYAIKLISTVKRLERMGQRRAPAELLKSLFSFMSQPYRIRLDHKQAYRKAFGNYTRQIIEEKKLEVLQDEHLVYTRNNYYPDLRALIFDAQKRADMERYAKTGRISNDGFSSYVVGISELGWINCDRFRQSTVRSTVTVLSGSEYQNTRYYMIFKDIRSILTGRRGVGQGQFKNVPVGEAVKLVALKLIDQKPHMAAMDHITGKNDIVKLDFNPVTLEQVKEELNSLDPMSSTETLAAEPVLSVKMFPNPTSESFSVTAEPKELVSEIAMYQMDGALVKSIPSESVDNEVSVTDLVSGTYVVSARYTNGQVASERIVIQK